MNANLQQSQPPQAHYGLSPGAVAGIVIGAFLATLLCSGAMVGVVYLGLPKAQEALDRTQVISARITTPPSVNDWWTQRVLADVYTAALDAVAGNEGVIERLGDPVEPDIAAETLYRRSGTAALVPGGIKGPRGAVEDTIEFDIQGPKGRGTVSVVAKGGIGNGQLQITTIKVKLDDGSTIDVPAPPQQKFAPR